MDIFDELEKIYSSFFSEMKIDNHTGIVSGTNRRFAAKPAIGKNFFSANKKILFVSLDIGKDENFSENTFQDYQKRTTSVCGQIPTNPHMAGVFGISLNLLQKENEWSQEWEIFETSNKFFEQIINANINKLPMDILTNIALINFYNFVEVGRIERSGNKDRIFLDEEKELQLLVDIINTLKPDEIIVHGKNIHNLFRSKIIPFIKKNCNIYLATHPSVIGRGIALRNPRKYIENMKQNLIKHNIQ